MTRYKKRPDGRYHTTIASGEFDENGKEIRIPVYGHSIAEFEANKDAVRAQVLSGSYANDKNTTFSKYKWQWYETYIQNTELSHARKEVYKNTLKNHTGLLDGLPLGTIKRSQVQNGYNALNGHPDLQHEYKITVRQIFRAAVDDHLIVRNPADNLTIAKTKKKKKRALTKIERSAIPRADLTLKERCFVEVIRYAGLRREEILAPLKPILAEYLKQLDGLIVFPNNQGTLMSRTQYRRFFEKIKLKINDAAGGRYHYERIQKGKQVRYKLVYDIDMCKGLSAHVFRHEFATILYYSGVDLLEAIRLFGHSDSKTLTDIYAELRKEESRSKDKLNEYLTKSYG